MRVAGGILSEFYSQFLSCFLFFIYIVDIADDHSIEHKILQNWNLLVDELEPYRMLKCFVKGGLLTDENMQSILSTKNRRTRVVSLLQTLLGRSDASFLNSFVQLLHLLDKNSAVKLDSKDANSIHQEAGTCNI